ncbi:phosphoadenosine phosphosulfate reductase family protein [Massilia agilis]|uniref:Phosphoadenosine phosphosulfate reductase family protein n=1 Tax=Massilia agilis TaxID=1811226 RepID=A0ABT2DBF7_9BURK|nr:phosphoadenosine phosphosulfate reductase family protein [Massilia agilis]
MKVRNILSYSGGKDSGATACVAIAQEVDPETFEAVSADTENELQVTYDHWSYFSEWLVQHGYKPLRIVRADLTSEMEAKRQFLLRIAAGEEVDKRGKHRWTPELAARAAELMSPTGNVFLDLCMIKGMFPSLKGDWCSERLKRDVLIEQVLLPACEAGGMVLSWQGVRIDESPRRRLSLQGTGACVRTCDEVGGGLFNYRPILRWNINDVFEAHRYMGLKLNPLYAKGFKRVGCGPCKYEVKDSVLLLSRHFPEAIARLREWERIVTLVSKMGMPATFFPIADGRGIGIDEVVEWSKTSRGGKQYDILRVDDQMPTMCSSLHGLCE